MGAIEMGIVLAWFIIFTFAFIVAFIATWAKGRSN